MVILLVLLTALGSTAAPATQPIPETKLTQWVVNLDDRAPTVRADASAQLMALTRGDLPRLKAVMEHARPLSAAQTGVLHDVVTHVFLTGEPYEKGNTGFLGMKMMQYYRFGNNPQPEEFGITVESRFPGFGAYRSLLDGDVILSIVEFPHVQLRIPKDFSDAVSPLAPGSQITLVVLRQARQLKIPVTLDARPAMLSPLVDPSTVEEFNANRVKSAEEYWKKEFGGLVDSSVSQAR